MKSIDLFDAKIQFTELVARAELGEDVVITRHGRPVAKLVSLSSARHSDTTARKVAIEALVAFEPIDAQGCSIDDFVRNGRD